MGPGKSGSRIAMIFLYSSPTDQKWSLCAVSTVAVAFTSHGNHGFRNLRHQNGASQLKVGTSGRHRYLPTLSTTIFLEIPLNTMPISSNIFQLPPGLYKKSALSSVSTLFNPSLCHHSNPNNNENFKQEIMRI